MWRGQVLHQLSRRVPVIVIVSLCAALLAAWTDLPSWLPDSLAIALIGLALILLATRDRRAQSRPSEQSADTGWLAHELAGHGSPPGTYALGFFAIVTIALTGFQGAYAMPAWAALALTAAWAVANAHYPRADGPQH